MKTTIIISNENYSVIDLAIEYPDWNGEEKYGVITNFTKEFIEDKFCDELKDYKPYIVISENFLEVRRNYRNNEKKFEMRILNYHALYSYEDGVTEVCNQNVYSDFEDTLIISMELQRVIDMLGEKEADRVTKKFFKKMTLREIGAEEGLSAAAIKYSVDKSLKKLKKFLKNT